MWSHPSPSSSGHFSVAAALLAVALTAPSAGAITQPTPGTLTIPTLNGNVTTCSDGNVEVCIDLSEGDAALIDVQADALVAPEVFLPTCTLTFKPITKGGGDHVAFGWYNIKPDPANPGQFLAPTQEELFGMFLMPFGNRNGNQLAGQEASLDLAAEAAAGRYKGGEIGFWLAGAGNLSSFTLDPETHALTSPTATLTRVFYTQHSLNPGSAGETTYYQVLTWQSVAFKNSFYFGWEDRVASSAADNDFDDLVFLVSGIQCTGGGEYCDTMQEGVCKDGTLQCQKGELTCVQNVQPSDEKCNALDDDCNGEVDDGDGLCEEGKVCDRGRCVPRCGVGEFRCPADLECTPRGVCVEKACAKVECPVGQICREGSCIDGCMDVICPYGSVCRNGGCVDPCDGVVCDEGFTCSLGICQSCECTECDAGKVCGATNVCVDAGCEGQTCAEGTHCSMGACVDDCDGAVCPQGQLCEAGECVVDPDAGANGGADGNGGGIVLMPGNGAGSSAGGASNGNGGPDGADGEPGSGSGQGEVQAKGCGCSVPGQSSSSRGVAFGALLGALVLARLRRRQAA